jgi:vancomycin resistance protein YoaR
MILERMVGVHVKVKKKIFNRIIVLELCLLVCFLFIIFTPHSNLSDIKNTYFRNNYIEGDSMIRNMYVKDMYHNLINEAKTKYASLGEKYIEFISDNLTEDIQIKDYISLSDVLINDITYKDAEIKLNYYNKDKNEYNIVLKTDFDTDKFTQNAIDLYSVYNVAMVAPKYSFNGSSLDVLDEGKVGQRLDEEKLSNDIQTALNNYSENENTCLGDVQPVYNDVEVYPSVDDIKSINTKISSFSTGYSTSSVSRKTNISVATNNINGTLLLPGETFSVDKTIKSRNASNGYAKAGSYLNGKTVQTYGGGVCQVSTTLYGAILRAGIIPIERNEHSMAVSYVPLGLDAAISEGYKDLKFTNTYDSPIYIQGSANGGTLTFTIYGKDGLLGGYTYQPGSSSSSNGLKADSWLNKYKDGNLVEKITLFKSSYRPHG